MFQNELTALSAEVKHAYWLPSEEAVKFPQGFTKRMKCFMN